MADFFNSEEDRDGVRLSWNVWPTSRYVSKMNYGFLSWDLVWRQLEMWFLLALFILLWRADQIFHQSITRQFYVNAVRLLWIHFVKLTIKQRFGHVTFATTEILFRNHMPVSFKISDQNSDRKKSFRNFFLILYPTGLHSPGPHESIALWSDAKFEREHAFRSWFRFSPQ